MADSECRKVGVVSAHESGCLVGNPSSVETRFGLVDCQPAGVGTNRTKYRWPLWTRDVDGELALGAMMVLADHIMGELAYVRRPSGQWSLTTELTVDFVGDVPSGDELHCSGELLVTQSPGEFARCQIGSAAEGTVAVGSSRVVYVPASGGVPDRTGPAMVAEVLDEVGSTSIDEVLGLHWTDDASEVQLTMANPGRWLNAFGILHGGVASCLSELAASRLAAAANPNLSTAQVYTCFLRPGAGDEPYIVSARIVHIGEQSGVVNVEGRRADGQLCTVSTVTSRNVR